MQFIYELNQLISELESKFDVNSEIVIRFNDLVDKFKYFPTPLSNDDLGDRMKVYERLGTFLKLSPDYPVVCRLDGNNFSKFTKDLDKPYDENFAKLMLEVTKFAAIEVGASLAFTQSDEITLVWKQGVNSQMYHDGKVFKIISKLAAKVSVRFNKLLNQYLPDKINDEPIFDCRVFNVPSDIEAYNAVLWRANDCHRNSVGGLFHYTYGHAKALNKRTYEKLDILEASNTKWSEYPPIYKYGIFVKRVKTNKFLTDEELLELPEKHDARTNPDFKIERSRYDFVEVAKPFNEVLNRVGFVLGDELPVFSNIKGINY